MEEKSKDALILYPIATIRTLFPTKFGIPRQGSVIDELPGTIIFNKEYDKEGIVKGLESYSHIWLLFGFSQNKDRKFRPTVRPPKLGGNTQEGVFATRSPYRPNPIGLTCCKLISIERKESTVLYVKGVDLVDKTPIYDIKPYLPYADSFPDAKGGFSSPKEKVHLRVTVPSSFLSLMKEEEAKILVDILSQDPRPGYQHEEGRKYSFEFSSYHIVFEVVKEKEAVVLSIQRRKAE